MSLPPHEATWFCEICCKSLDPSPGSILGNETTETDGNTAYSIVRYGLVVSIPDSHPGGLGSIPGNETTETDKNRKR